MRSWGCRRALLVAGLVIAAGASDREAVPSAQTVDAPCHVRTTERVVAVGDVHGAYDRFVGILRAANLLDRRDRWIGGRAHLVQTGDVLDRGADSRRVVDLLRRLERDAARAGGRVHALMGNHEFMRLVGDWRYVSPGELRAFTTGESEDLRDRVHTAMATQAADRARAEKRLFDPREYRERFMQDLPLGFIEMRVAFDTGDYGRWVRERVAAVRINGVLFLHGGVSEQAAALGCEGLNAAVQRDVAALPVPPEKVASLFPSAEHGPLWYRGMASEPEETFAPVLDRILQQMDARAVVIGHTPVSAAQVQTRFGGRVVLIDTGMLNGEFYPGGVASALEWQGDTLTAVYEGRREPLTAPAVHPVPATAGGPGRPS
jgi:hypothetical protein